MKVLSKRACCFFQPKIGPADIEEQLKLGADVTVPEDIEEQPKIGTDSAMPADIEDDVADAVLTTTTCTLLTSGEVNAVT